MKKLIIIALLICGCKADDFNPKPPQFEPNDPSFLTFQERLENLVDKEISTYAEDKQKHYTVSKELITFNYLYAETKTDFGTLMYAFVATLQSGYEKEIGDVSGESGVDWQVIYKEIRKLDFEIQNQNLDQPDLMADWIGAATRSIKHAE